jgi:hypothetical protein
VLANGQRPHWPPHLLISAWGGRLLFSMSSVNSSLSIVKEKERELLFALCEED